MNDTVNQIAGMYSELEHLRAKDHASEKMIHLLKGQNEFQAMEMTQMAAEHADEVRKLRQRCDFAVRRETEISGILDTVANSIVLGMRKMKGDETPPKMPERKLPEIEDNRLQPVSRDDRLPAPELMPRFDPYAPKPRGLSADVPRRTIEQNGEEYLDDGLADLVNRLPRSHRG